jgi:S-DNA-T family DNA segregation ATPase FtsK/SpoIIIE
VRPLPGRLAVDDVPALAAAAGRPVADQPGLLLGVGEFRLAPQLVDLTAAGAHLLVFGDEGSGRTTLLRRAVEHLAATTDPDDVRLHLIDLGRGLLDLADLPAVEHYAFTASLAETLAGDLLKELVERLPPPDLDRRSLLDRTWWSGPEHVVVIDDYELTLGGPQGPLTPMADAIAYARDIGLHVVLARRVAGASRTAYEPFGQRMRELASTALLLDGERSEGPLVGERTATRQPPGRGLLVRRGAPDTLVQLAMPSPAGA